MQVELIQPAAPSAPLQPAPAPTGSVPMVVMAQAGDPPASEIADEVVDRAEIVGGKTLIQLSRSEKMVADLRAARAALTLTMATTKEAAATRAFRALCVKERTAIAAKALDLRRPAIDFGKKVIAAETPLVDEIKQMEKEADDIIKADEKKKADEKAQREKEEAERRALEDQALEEIRSRIEACINQPAAFIAETIEWLDNTGVTEEDFRDRAGEALALLISTRAKLADMLIVQQGREKADAEAKQRADELAQREAAIVKREAVAKRIDELRTLSARHVESDAATIGEAMELCVLDPEWFGDRYAEAKAVADAARAELTDLHAAAIEEEEAEQLVSAAFDEPAAVVSDPIAHAVAEPVAAPAPAAAAVVHAAPAAAAAAAAAAAPSYRAASVEARTRPSDGAIVGALSLRFRATETEVLSWLRAMNFDAQAERIKRGL